MQEKERERKGKNGKIIKVAGCSPIREGVLLIKPDTTLADVKKFGEECQRRWGITPLQIFLHKDEGHWLNGQPNAEDKESFQVGKKWFKPNYHAPVSYTHLDVYKRQERTHPYACHICKPTHRVYNRLSD